MVIRLTIGFLVTVLETSLAPSYAYAATAAFHSAYGLICACIGQSVEIPDCGAILQIEKGECDIKFRARCDRRIFGHANAHGRSGAGVCTDDKFNFFWWSNRNLTHPID